MLTLPCTRPSDGGAGSPSRDPVQVIQNRMRPGSEELCKHFVDADEDKFVVVTKVKRFRESCGSPKVRDPEVGHALALGNDRCVEYRPFVRRTVDASCVEAGVAALRNSNTFGVARSGLCRSTKPCDRSREGHEFAFRPSPLDRRPTRSTAFSEGNIVVPPLRRDCAAAGRMNGRRRSRHALRSSAMRRLRPACVAGRDGRPPSRRLETLARLAGVWAQPLSSRRH